MKDTSELIARAERVAEDQGLSLATVSRYLFVDCRRIARLKGGNSYLRPPTLAKAAERLAALEAREPKRRPT
jgi:hypothetical protein